MLGNLRYEDFRGLLGKLLQHAYTFIIFCNSEETFLKYTLLKYSPKKAKLLDVGCGYGRFYNIIVDSGIDYYGVDINRDTVNWNKSQNRKSFHTTDNDYKENNYDLIMLAHVIEHCGYSDLKDLLNTYTKLLDKDGLLIIFTPLMHRGFYDDSDHVKPYNPDALRQLLCHKTTQIQDNGVSGQYAEVALWLKNDPLWHSYFVKKWHHLIKVPLSILCGLSYGLIGKRTGYGMIFRKLS